MLVLRQLISFAILFVALASPVVAASSSGSSDVRTFVTLHVNAIDQGETVAVLRGKDVLVPVSILETAGVHGITGARETMHNEQYVSLASLSPDVTYAFDVDALSLDITVNPKHLATTSIDLSKNRPADIRYPGGKSAYLNYAFTGASGGLASGFFEGGIAHDQDSLHYSFTAASGESVRRGLIYYQLDDRDSSVRRVVGDLNANSGDLGGSAYMAGIGFARAFDLDPYAIYYPLPSLSGVAATPSVASIYVNGVLVQRVNLPPGSFNLGDLPITTGNANAQVVLTDAFGRTQTYSRNYYVVANLLRRGLTDYQFAVGALRDNAFQVGDSYGPAVAVGRYRVGVSNSLTAGGRFEVTPHLVSGGPEIDIKLPVGFVHVAAAASKQDGLGGAAASLGYSYTAARLGFGFSVLTQGPHYATISQSPSLDRTLSAYGLNASMQIGRTSTLTAQYYRRRMRDTGTNDQISVSDTIMLHRDYSLTLTAERDRSTTGSPVNGLSATLNFSVGKTQAAITGQNGNGQSSISLQRSPDEKYGLHYNAEYSPTQARTLNASAGYRSPYGDVSIDYGTSAGGASNEAVRIAGGIAAIDGGLYLTRPVLGSFALVDVPGVAGVDVYAENELVGKTNRAGKLIVPDLLANYGNTIRIDDRDVAVNTSIQGTQQLVAPGERSGAVVTFAAHELHAMNGSILVNLRGAQVVPSYGELTLRSGDTVAAESVLGKDGEFYLENVAPGEYLAHVEFAQGTCEFEFRAPQASGILVKLGQLGCVVK